MGVGRFSPPHRFPNVDGVTGSQCRRTGPGRPPSWATGRHRTPGRTDVRGVAAKPRRAAYPGGLDEADRMRSLRREPSDGRRGSGLFSHLADRGGPRSRLEHRNPPDLISELGGPTDPGETCHQPIGRPSRSTRLPSIPVEQRGFRSEQRLDEIDGHRCGRNARDGRATRGRP